MHDDRIRIGSPAFGRTSAALFAAGFATFALLYCVQPLLPMFSASFGVGAAGASLALSLTTGLLAASMLVAGVLSESWGRKPMMVGSLLLSALLALFSAHLPHWQAFLATRALMGVALSGLPAVAMAYVGEEMHPRSLSSAMGLYVAGTGLGGMAGRLLTGLLTDWWGWRNAMLAMGMIALVCVVMLWRWLPASRHFNRRPLRLKPLIGTYGRHARDDVLPWLFAEGFLLMGAFVTIYNYAGYRLIAPPYLLSQTGIGLIFSVYLFGILCSAGIGSLSARVGRRTLLSAMIVAMALGVALTHAHGLVAIVSGIAILTAGFFGAHSTVSAWVGARVATGKAQASSLYLFAYYMGSSVLGSLGGWFWGESGWAGVEAMALALLATALIVARRLRTAGPTP